MASSIIGNRGTNVKELIARTKSNISVSQVHDYYPNTSNRIVIISGTLSAVSFSQSLICIRTSRLAKNDTPDEDRYTSLEALQQAPEDVMQHFVNVKISIPELAAGLLIGRAGEFVKLLSGQAGAAVKFADTATMNERLVHIDGPCVSCIVAINLILEKMVSEPRMSRYSNYNASYAPNPNNQMGMMSGGGGGGPRGGVYSGHPQGHMQQYQGYGAYGQAQGYHQHSPSGQYPSYGQQFPPQYQYPQHYQHQQQHQHQQAYRQYQHGSSGAYPSPPNGGAAAHTHSPVSPASSVSSPSPPQPFAPSVGSKNSTPVPGLEVVSTSTTMVVSVAAELMTVLVSAGGSPNGTPIPEEGSMKPVDAGTVLDDISAGTNVTITHTRFSEVNVAENIPCNVTLTGSHIGVQSAHNRLVEKCRATTAPVEPTAPVAAAVGAADTPKKPATGADTAAVVESSVASAVDDSSSTVASADQATRTAV